MEPIIETPEPIRRHAPGHGLQPQTADNFLVNATTDESFWLLAEYMPTLCCMANADGYVFWYNQRWLDYAGSTLTAMTRDGWHSMHKSDDLPDVNAMWQSSLDTGEPFETILALKGSDGLFREFMTRVVPLRDNDGNITRWLCISTDISAQVAAEREMLEINRKYQAVASERDALLSQLGESVIVADPDGRITFMNEAAVELHGLATLDTVPDGYAESYGLFTLAGDVHPIETLPLTRAVRNLERVTNAEWRIRRPDGTEVLASGNAKPFYADDGVLLGAVLSIRDETIRHAGDVARAEVARLNELLLSEVNHRVKNSLQLVTSMLAMEAGKSNSVEVKRVLADASSRIAVVAAIHHRLYSSGKHNRVDLSAYLRDLGYETIGALNDKCRVEIDFCGPPSVFLEVDRAIPLALILSELLTNAVKYAFNGMSHGVISVSVAIIEMEILVTISDNGCGLPEDFDPKQRGSLGMEIVMALTSQLRAKFLIIRQERGTRFDIQFPAKPVSPIVF